jgi:hypothetical protein
MSGLHSRGQLPPSKPRYFDMDWLSAFGLSAVTAMLIFYALEDHSPAFVLAFAAACGLASVYGFLQGAWPFGLIEAVWTLIAIQRWRKRTASREGIGS